MADKTATPAAPSTPRDDAPPDDRHTRRCDLPVPVDVEGMGTVRTLWFREPLNPDLYTLSLVDLAQSRMGPLMDVAARVHRPRLPPDAWQALGLADTLAIAGAVSVFFADASQALGMDLDGLAAETEAETTAPSSTSRT
ncbi:hypothetical protein [Roseospira visakhapatnamensis]|uniref:Tail assembly chaperone E/41/14-like protein n=1 Tax=Roseospira visakhapatnamensis TaxID=390880 RepID=A0A7W6RF20_9PROT|nr:hypothetical protein [Roseospira visakhapatnamensis]MBB4266881.1 hypothetical protein [Roseospira visakhapatnamensis]